jgi:hypothetical protein
MKDEARGVSEKGNREVGCRAFASTARRARTRATRWQNLRKLTLVTARLYRDCTVCTKHTRSFVQFQQPIARSRLGATDAFFRNCSAAESVVSVDETHRIFGALAKPLPPQPLRLKTPCSVTG